jgi:hypothetical protein
MIKFIKVNRGFIILCVVFSLVNKFPFFSLGNILAWVLFFAGIYYKEKANMDYFSSLGDTNIAIYTKVIKILNQERQKANRLLKAIARLNISSDTETGKKLYQTRRLAYKVLSKSEIKEDNV